MGGAGVIVSQLSCFRSDTNMPTTRPRVIVLLIVALIFGTSFFFPKEWAFDVCKINNLVLRIDMGCGRK